MAPTLEKEAHTRKACFFVVVCLLFVLDSLFLLKLTEMERKF